MQRNLCDRIIKLDRNIRFVGIVNSRGEVIEGGFQQGVRPLLNETEEQQMYIQSLWNLTTLESYSGRLGKVRYSITEHERVTLMTFPLANGILCLSTTPKANMNKIRDKVMKTIKEKPGNKKNNRKKRDAKG
ncbi:MAG TPA: DUF6659 family protein [Nitrososphaera sp.]